MIIPRRGHERGHAQHGWLDSHHSFSFANYYDPRHMGVSTLLVINDDWVKPGAGFDTHPHRDMEIISYVLEGAIEHRDTMGFHTRIKAGEVQVMSAGTGIQHSEFNASDTEDVNFLQIWIAPEQGGVTPRYEQQDFSDTEGVRLIVSPNGQHGSLSIHQDARLFKIRLQQQAVAQQTTAGRTYYLHVAKGALEVNGTRMEAGDGATLTDEAVLNIKTLDQVEALLFDLP